MTDTDKLRVQLFKEHVIKVFKLCKKKLGKSKYRKEFPALLFIFDEDEVMGGYYCHVNNIIEITYQGFDDSKYCFDYYSKVVYHEFIHYLQSPIWFKRYYSMGHDYLSHPYEIEAYKRETEVFKYIKYGSN